jgi:hypothetical protein
MKTYISFCSLKPMGRIPSAPRTLFTRESPVGNPAWGIPNKPHKQVGESSIITPSPNQIGAHFQSTNVEFACRD